MHPLCICVHPWRRPRTQAGPASLGDIVALLGSVDSVKRAVATQLELLVAAGILEHREQLYRRRRRHSPAANGSSSSSSSSSSSRSSSSRSSSSSGGGGGVGNSSGGTLRCAAHPPISTTFGSIPYQLELGPVLLASSCVLLLSCSLLGTAASGKCATHPSVAPAVCCMVPCAC